MAAISITKPKTSTRKSSTGFRDNFDQTIIKVQSDLITVRKAGKDQPEFLKMSDALLANINQVTDPNLKATLLGIESCNPSASSTRS